MANYYAVLSEIRDNLKSINESLLLISESLKRMPIELIVNANKASHGDVILDPMSDEDILGTEKK